MSDEEVKPVEKAEEVEAVVEVVEPTPTEATAMDQGWLPKEKWEESGRDPNDWRSAKEFKERGDLFKTIHQTKRELKATQSTLDSLKRHHQFVFDQAFRKAQSELRKERREAMREDNIDRVEEIETELETQASEYNTQRTQLVQEPAAVGPPPEFDTWRQKNSWYDEDDELRDEADAIGIVYNKRNPGILPEKVLQFVEREVMKKHPEKFGIRKAAPNAVASVDRSSSSRLRSEPAFQLNEFEEQICKDLVNDGIMTRAQYIKELKGSK